MFRDKARKLLILAVLTAVTAFLPALAPVTAVIKPLVLREQATVEANDVPASAYNYEADPLLAQEYNDGQDLGYGCWPAWNDRPRVFRPFVGGPIRRAFWALVCAWWCW
jgi:hypothetical protein